MQSCRPRARQAKPLRRGLKTCSKVASSSVSLRVCGVLDGGCKWGRVLQRDQLLDCLAGREWQPFDRSIDVLIGRLRNKIGLDPKASTLIVTVHGVGYLFMG
ncbi:MAG: winged helix-turn-helix domain-containing protein [Hoeflea sp.]|nr:winged helix-turn-helix domain-containing protein [Hoeflea sp.]